MSTQAHQSEALLLGEGTQVVCRCVGVTELEIRTAVDVTLARTLDEVSEQTGAGTGCGACHCRIRRVINGLPSSCGGSCSRCEGCGSIRALCSCCPGEPSEAVA